MVATGQGGGEPGGGVRSERTGAREPRRRYRRISVLVPGLRVMEVITAADMDGGRGGAAGDEVGRGGGRIGRWETLAAETVHPARCRWYTRRVCWSSLSMRVSISCEVKPSSMM
jgi:hypothetical protein